MSEDLLDYWEDAQQSREEMIQAIVRAHDEGFTYREIGARLGIAHSWARKLYLKGKK